MLSFKLAVLLSFLLTVSARSILDSKLQFAQFMKAYNKEYISEEEQQKRFEIFQSNLAKADLYNSKSTSAKYGINKFADLTSEEFRHFFLIENFESFRDQVIDGASAVPLTLPKHMVIPVSFDWRDKNAVTPVKNQEQCGSCWAFSTVEAVESAWFLADHPLVSLSPQQIVDCDIGNGDEGCSGGDTTTAYAYVMKAGGLETESDYPYTGENGTCMFQKKEVVASIANWTYITQDKNETQMQIGLVAQGPLSICVDAESWQLYIEGVVTSSEICGDNLDHCVMITGFQDYSEVWGTYQVWNIRNSWGADWGMDGYILVERGYDLCGVADEVTIPIVN